MQMKILKTVSIGLCLLLVVGCQTPNDEPAVISTREYLLSESDLPAYEADIDHAYYIERLSSYEENWAMQNSGVTIYRSTCYSCHGNNEQPGSLPDSKKFWKEAFLNGSDPYSMYQTITRGFGLMPPQPHLSPSQKYDVIAFIREELIKPTNPDEYDEVDAGYLASLPDGDSLGPEPQPYHPWADLDYGNWFIHCYEMADSNDPPKVISGGRAPLPNEDYGEVNFAYKGIAMRLDHGPGGVAAGNTFVMFDHDLLRFVGAWTGEGFIDWEDILLDDQHNVYPRTVGKQQFANPITPGWADPSNGEFEDPRFRGLDGRPFGPLPRDWSHYKGLYRHDDRIVIKYTVDDAEVLETYDLITPGNKPIIARTLNLSGIDRTLKMRIAPSKVSVVIKGEGVSLAQQDGYHIATFLPSSFTMATIYMSARDQSKVDSVAMETDHPIDLDQYTKGSKRKYEDVLTSPIIRGNDEDPYAVDVLVLPQVNPWNTRLRLTGIDFLEGGEEAVVSTIDGEVFRVEGITSESGPTRWHRIATGLFQPLGIKLQDGKIYVGCRDQIVILHDLNSDGETDYYESFNSDHQVTEHFHEFAMGLQTDNYGNFYYAKSGRHARTSLVPQHGTLIKVSADGKTSEILANGFRAANGVCLNPDGSFYVTDQQGFWNPMNRINRVTKGGFYGNMWGYGAPSDSSDAAMIQPMMWVDMKYDRSPSELVWAMSDRWGPLNGSLLNLSYGYGKIFVVMPQMVNGQEQGGMVELPVPMFPTGIMRARVNPKDGQLYVCGMSAWATSRMIQVGGLYRIRYTGKPLNLPVSMKAVDIGMQITFSEPLDRSIAEDLQNFEVNTWDLKRTRIYGSDRYNEKRLTIERVILSDDDKTILIYLPEIKPTWVMDIHYQLRSREGKDFDGVIQNSIYQLEELES